MSYAAEIALALELVQEFGGPVIVNLPGDVANYDAFGVIVPYSGQGAPNEKRALSQQAIIPCSGLTIELVADARITDAAGSVWAIQGEPVLLAPNAVERILYDCEVRKWPGT